MQRKPVQATKVKNNLKNFAPWMVRRVIGQKCLMKGFINVSHTRDGEKANMSRPKTQTFIMLLIPFTLYIQYNPLQSAVSGVTKMWRSNILIKKRFFINRAHTAKQIRIMYSQKSNCAALFPVSILIHLWAIYIFPGSVHLFCCSKIDRPIRGNI